MQYHSNSILQNPVKANRLVRSSVVGPSSYAEKGMHKYVQQHYT